MEQCKLIKLARLGNKEAAKRLTDAANFREQIENEALNRNTRAPILSAEELKKLEALKDGSTTD